MKLSTRGRYGTRAMHELALHWNQGPVMLRSIAANQNISAKYLEQLLTQIKNAGLIRVVRGAKGGFLLSKPPQEITLKEILFALEGDLSLVECVSFKDYCEMSDDCPTRWVWVELSRTILSTLETLTLQDLLERSNEKKKATDHVEKSLLQAISATATNKSKKQ
ncbi:RrF2 family transcriptional regulator [Acidobacteriota bacterium]